MEELALDIWRGGRWQKAAHLRFRQPERGAAGPIELVYTDEYVEDVFEREGMKDVGGHEAVSCSAPVGFVAAQWDHWPAWLDDLRPGGAAYRWWVHELGIANESDGVRDWLTLKHGTVAPVGNVRLHRPASVLPSPRLPVASLIEQERIFLEIAREHGATVGGATGAHGDARKFLVRRSDTNQIWIDNEQSHNSPDQYYLVKFARGKRRASDQDILRAEYCFYRALQAVGFDTVPVDGLELHESRDPQTGPSLWMPRFDVISPANGDAVRHGVESWYALCDQPAGSVLPFFMVLRRLLDVVQPDKPTEVVAEVIARDIANVLLGNSDNHGRNSAVLRTVNGNLLAPMYDVTPMRVDDEVIVRQTRWRTRDGTHPDFETGGEFNWFGIIGHAVTVFELAEQGDDGLLTLVRQKCLRLADLPAQAIMQEIPDAVRRHPLMRLDSIPERLREWGLIP